MGLSSRLNPTLADALEAVTEHRTREVRTAEPGRIISYDPEKNRAEVELCIKGKLYCVDGYETTPAPLLPTVPVLWPRGGGAFITWPLKKGDYCLVIVQRKSIDQWCAKGGTQVDPIFDWYHCYDDAVAIPGFYPYPEALKHEDLDNIVLGFEKGGVRLKIKEDSVEVTSNKGEAIFKARANGIVEVGGGDVKDFVALAGKVMEELEEIRSKFNAHTHQVETTGTASAQKGTASAPDTKIPAAQGVGAKRAKAS